MSAIDTNNGLTLTVLGCGELHFDIICFKSLLMVKTGTMGIAILSGIMETLTSISTSSSAAGFETPPRLPTRFHACVRRPTSAERIKKALQKYSHIPLSIHIDDNIPALEAADVVLLGCKPQMVTDVLSPPEIQNALRNKVLISILAGVPVSQLESIIEPNSNTTIVRAMPNTASAVRESMTVIALPEKNSNSQSHPSSEQMALVNWIFSRIGRTITLPAANMDAATALCGSGPAFMALVLEAIADGAVAMGLPRKEAQEMAAMTMRGTTGLVLDGEHPAILRDKVSTPGGCTIGGLLVLEEGRVRGTLARAVREATVVASQLGKGVQGVNGTRFN